jgi:phosphopantetheinyl transferase
VEPTSNCSSASGGALFAGAAAVMQAVESQNLILYHTDLRGQWPESAARAFAARLPYARRLALSSGGAARKASLAGIALALRALAQLLRRRVSAAEIVFAHGEKPALAQPARLAAANAPAPARVLPGVTCGGGSPDFSISHSGPWVGCAALACGRVGLDIEMGTDARIADWVLREAALKASGSGLRAARELRELEVREARAYWRGEWWHVRRLELFAGASACVLTSVAIEALQPCALPLEELLTS